MRRPHLQHVVVAGEVHVRLGLVQDRVLAAAARGESGAGSCEHGCTQDGDEFGARHLHTLRSSTAAAAAIGSCRRPGG